jgi:hypothetical protein
MANDEKSLDRQKLGIAKMDRYARNREDSVER